MSRLISKIHQIQIGVSLFTYCHLNCNCHQESIRLHHCWYRLFIVMRHEKSVNKAKLRLLFHFLNGPRQANFVLIAYASSEGSGEPAHPRLRIHAVSPEPSLLAHTSSESKGTFRQKARSLAPLNGWACAVKICHDGMLEDTNSLDAAQIIRLNV